MRRSRSREEDHQDCGKTKSVHELLPLPMSANSPQLPRICIAGEKNEWRLIGGNSAGLGHTLTPHSHDLTVPNAPLLAEGAGAINQYDWGSVDWRAALHVNTAAETLRNHPGFDEPSLVRATVTLHDDERRAIRGLPVARIHTFTRPADQLRADNRNGIRNGNI